MQAYLYGAGMLTRNVIIATIPVTSPWLQKSELGLMMLIFLLALVFLSWQRPGGSGPEAAARREGGATSLRRRVWVRRSP